MKATDLSGSVFGHLVVVGPDRASGRLKWRCQCDCGSTTFQYRSDLMRGKVLSCGCGQGEHHGGSSTRLFRIWSNMRARCENPRVRTFARYGGRGIAVCDQWQSFTAFREWAMLAGYRDDLTIDRIDNDGHYEPTNCRWVSQRQQLANMPGRSRFGIGVRRVRSGSFTARIKINGKTMHLGTYPTAEMAASAYTNAADHFGGF